MKNSVELANSIDKYIRPLTFAIGVKLLKSRADLPANVPTAPRALNHKVALCQGFGFARRNRLTMAMFKEDMVCPVGIVVMGLAERPEYILNGSNSVGRGNRSLEAASLTEREMNHFDPGEYSGLVTGPLTDTDFDPDIALVYVNAIQVTRLIQAALYNQGGRFSVSVIPSAVCADALVPAVKTGKCSIGLPCWGDRTHTGTTDNELIFSIPAARFDEISSGLAATAAGATIPIPLPTSYELHMPDKYKQYMKDLGIEG